MPDIKVRIPARSFRAGCAWSVEVVRKRIGRRIIDGMGIGRGFVTGIRVGADGGDFSFDEQGFGGMGYATRAGHICGLGANNRRKQHREEESEYDSVHKEGNLAYLPEVTVG